MLKETIVVVALQLCPWQPATLPPVEVLPDTWFDTISARLGYKENLRGLTFWYDKGPFIYLRQSTASDRILCHEWRHVVEGDWHPGVTHKRSE